MADAAVALFRHHRIWLGFSPSCQSLERCDDVSQWKVEELSDRMRRLSHQTGSASPVTLLDYITCMMASYTTYGHKSVLKLLGKWAESTLGGHPLAFTSMTLNRGFANEMDRDGPSPSTNFDLTNKAAVFAGTR